MALAFVLALMGLFALAAKRAGWGNLPGARGRGRRLSVIEIRPIDTRHKLVLVRCDAAEHLLLLGPEGQTVIAAGLPPAPEPDKDVIPL